MTAHARLSLLLLATGLATTMGLRVEDAGRWDWHKQLFKSVSDVSIAGKRVYIAGDGAVGAVGKEGRVMWRRKVGEGGGWVEKISGGVLTVEKQSGKTTLFLEDGALAWEGNLPHDATPLGISGETGEEWPAVITLTHNTIKVHPVHVDGALIKFGKVTELPSPIKTDDSNGLFHVSQGVLYALNDGNLYELQLSSMEWLPVKKTPFQKNDGKLIVAHADSASISIYSEKKEICYNSSEKEVKHINDVTKCVPGASVDIEGSKMPFEKTGGISNMWSVKTQSYGVKIVVKYTSGDMEFLGNWYRNDGLAETTSVKAYDIPTDVQDDADLGDVAEYSDLVQNQIASAIDFAVGLPKMTTEAVELITAGVKEEQSYDSRENAFGLQKILLLKSETQLFSVNTKDGSMNWQINIAGLDETCSGDSFIKDFFITVSTHVLHSHPKIFAWISISANSEKLVEICPETGLPTTTHVLSKPASVVFVTESYLHHGYQALVVVSGNTVKVYPEEAELVSNSDLLRYHTFSKETGEASGYAITKNLVIKKIWGTTILSTPEEQVAATSLDNYNKFGYINTDVIYVHGNHSTGKNEVLTKYVNPNAFVVVTTVPKKNQEETQDAPKREGYLVLYLVDGVTGAILTSMVQTNAGGAVSVTALEHMYLYSFFNMKRKRYQLGVWSLFKDIDLYKGMTSESTTSLKYIMQAAVGLPENSYSSYEEASPRLIPAAFTFPAPVTSMTVTVSEKGVATKQLLVSLATDEIISIDIQKHIAANMQQGNTLVSWMPTSHLTYNLTVMGVASLSVFPTKLESTCLMVAHGGDLFFSRTTSGKPFDVLPEDFEYTLLLLLTITIIGTTFVLSMLSRRDTLKAQWL